MNFMEFAKYKTRSNFPTIGNVQRLYLSMDDNKLYHWSYGEYHIVSANAFEEDPSPITLGDVVTVEQLNNALGDIDSALDAILGV